jgi:hypothetical protein
MGPGTREDFPFRAEMAPVNGPKVRSEGENRLHCPSGVIYFRFSGLVPAIQKSQTQGEQR